jgi:EAL domain-containing protein (putative c-di-GMP-specific phosphodiesterase class I)
MATGCQDCRRGGSFELPISIAFQPIVDVSSGEVYGHEALVRGAAGEGAGTVLAKVSDDNRYAFDQQCRVTAIEWASRLYEPGEGTRLSINFMPNAVYEPKACIRLTLATAERVGFPLEDIIFEFTETEKLDTVRLLNILKTYRDIGFKTAIDDFGAGHSGLALLTKFQPDIVKLDMDLVRGIDKDRVKRVVVANTIAMLRDLDITPLCEGIETRDELETLRDLGIDLIQGYFLAKPAFEALAVPRNLS